MQRERAALALFLLRRKQARPAREPDAIFEKSAISKSAFSIQNPSSLFALSPQWQYRWVSHFRVCAFRGVRCLSYL